MTFNSKLADDILEAIFPLPEHFGIIVPNDDDAVPICFNLLQEKVEKVDPCAELHFGMSKFVITSYHLGNVAIKIPFNGYYECGWDYENDCDDLDNLEWYDFCWATGPDSSDYCLAEYEKYKRLKTYGLDCFVTKTIFYKEICGVRIFIQEFATSICDDFTPRRASKGSHDLAFRWQKERKFNMDVEWIANCLDKYGKSKVTRFLLYCENLDPDILEDIHSGNYGYRNDGTPCILDFSNFLN